jgi:hypothetical protein
VVRCLTSLAIADPARVLPREYHCHSSIAEDFSDSSLPWRLKRRTVTSPLAAIEIALGAVVDGKRCGPKRWYHSIASAEPGRPSRATKRRLTTVREPTVDKEIAEGDNEANENKRAAAGIWEVTGELASASLVHDADFRKPRCTFPFGSSTFHEPGYCGASARLRVCASSSVYCFVSIWFTYHRGTNVVIHTYPIHQI